MKVKKNISIEEELRERAVKKAKKMGLTFSSYITYLINKDLGEIAFTEEPINNKASNAISDILDM